MQDSDSDIRLFLQTALYRLDEGKPDECRRILAAQIAKLEDKILRGALDPHDHGNATGSACDSREPACRYYLEQSGERCTFDLLYPAALIGCEKSRNYVKLLEQPEPCFWCGTLTQWVEINYEGPLCSLRCEDEIGMDIYRLSQEHERQYGTGAENVSGD